MRRGLVSSRQQAATAVGAGRVLVAGAVADKVARLVSPSESLTITGPPPRFVSRGGEKLDAALDRFGVDVAGKVALDAGASTGGFTDCLLQRGATRVVAVDVGRAQLHQRLRADPRVVTVEGVNIRRAGAVPEAPFPVVVADLSFISLRTVAPVLCAELAAEGADIILLVKPQFEAGRAEVSKGRGVIRDPDTWRRVLQGVGSAVAGAGAAMMGVMPSPLRGADGNVEFLLHAVAHRSGPDIPPGLEDALAAAEG